MTNNRSDSDRALLLVRPFRRAAHMQMAQIAQRALIFFAHPARKVRIIQPLIPRRLRHILQHPQPLLNRLAALRRHLLPFRQHIVAHVIALLRRHLLPHLRALLQLFLLHRRQIPQPLLVLRKSLPFQRRHTAEAIPRVRRRRPIQILRPVRPIEILRRWRPILLNWSSLALATLWPTLRRPLWRPLRRTIGPSLRVRTICVLPVAMLRPGARRHQRSRQSQAAQPSTEFEAKFHLTYIC
jgi:hypothetical protein